MRQEREQGQVQIQGRAQAFRRPERLGTQREQGPRQVRTWCRRDRATTHALRLVAGFHFGHRRGVVRSISRGGRSRSGCFVARSASRGSRCRNWCSVAGSSRGVGRARSSSTSRRRGISASRRLKLELELDPGVGQGVAFVMPEPVIGGAAPYEAAIAALKSERRVAVNFIFMGILFLETTCFLYSLMDCLVESIGFTCIYQFWLRKSCYPHRNSLD